MELMKLNFKIGYLNFVTHAMGDYNVFDAANLLVKDPAVALI